MTPSSTNTLHYIQTPNDNLMLYTHKQVLTSFAGHPYFSLVQPIHSFYLFDQNNIIYNKLLFYTTKAKNRGSGRSSYVLSGGGKKKTSITANRVSQSFNPFFFFFHCSYHSFLDSYYRGVVSEFIVPSRDIPGVQAEQTVNRR